MSEEIDRGEKKPAWGSFWALIGVQVQNSFTVSVIKFLLIPLGASLALQHQGGALAASTEYVLSLLLVFPYLLLSPTAGWIADRFPKSMVIKFAAWAQWFLVLTLCVAVMLHSLVLAMFCFFLYSLQCAMLSPAKLGVIKELVGSRRLAFANGVVEGTAILAILAGQIAGGVWFDANSQSMNGWDATLHSLWWVAGVALVGALLAQMMRRTRAQGDVQFRSGLMFRHIIDSAVVWKDRELRFAALGTAFFWAFAGFVNLVVIEIAKTLHPHEVGSAISKLMFFASLGIASGSIFAGLLSKRGIEWSLAPIGLVLMSSGLCVLSQIHPGSGLFPCFLALSGAGAAIFLVPVNTFVQDHPPAEKRGTVISVSNFFNNVGGVSAVLIQFTMMKAGLHVQYQFLILAVLTSIIAYLAVKKWLPELLRVLILPIVRLVYRIRVLDAQNIPESGGVLLLPNHVTWADCFLISAVCDRPVRFVMYEGFVHTFLVGWGARVFNTMPISATKAKEAIRAVSESLANGDVVCLFAEGELTRTGCLQEIKRGFELMAHKAGAPVVPIWMDGAWGSIFSFERNKFFRKLPRSLPFPLTIAIHPSIPAREASIAVIENALHRASASALAARVEKAGLLLKPDAPFWVNGFQLGHVNALQRGATFVMWDGDTLNKELDSLRIGFAGLYGSEVLTNKDAVLSSAIRVGGDATRRLLLESADVASDGVFYDFDATPTDWPLKIFHCPCYAVNGIVIAMSMPDPPLSNKTSEIQYGCKAGSVGRLLPGFATEQGEDGRICLHGPALSESGLLLPLGISIDAQGFVFLPTPPPLP